MLRSWTAIWHKAKTGEIVLYKTLIPIKQFLMIKDLDDSSIGFISMTSYAPHFRVNSFSLIIGCFLSLPNAAVILQQGIHQEQERYVSLLVSVSRNCHTFTKQPCHATCSWGFSLAQLQQTTYLRPASLSLSLGLTHSCLRVLYTWCLYLWYFC